MLCTEYLTSRREVQIVYGVLSVKAISVSVPTQRKTYLRNETTWETVRQVIFLKTRCNLQHYQLRQYKCIIQSVRSSRKRESV
jgi:S-adenosylmethionine synthetase